MQERISAYLDRRGLAHAVEQGVAVVPYGRSADAGRPPELVLLLWGGEAAVNGVMVELHTRALPPDADLDLALRRCNEWNIACRTSKARLQSDPEPSVVLEAWMPAGAHVPEELLDEFLDRAIADMVSSWAASVATAET